MLIIEASHIKMHYGDRLILEFEKMNIDTSDRIGIVGLNGAGKTTLMDILAQRLQPDEGVAQLYGQLAYIPQLDEWEQETQEEGQSREFGFAEKTSHMSGGEIARWKIAQGLGRESHILLADEPTSNLDLKGIGLLERRLIGFKGAVVLISHDRALLDKVCNKIWEIETGQVTEYPGNYSAYLQLKEAKKVREQLEYEEYVKERIRLENALKEKAHQAVKMKKTPSRMGNSEARLHKRGVGEVREKLEKATIAMQSRLDRLDKKEKPRTMEPIRIDLGKRSPIYAKIVITAKHVSKAFDDRILFSDVNFHIKNGTRTVLMGDNGTGKTTLLKMILSTQDGIQIAQAAKIGYFSQDLDILDVNQTIIENVMEKSIYEEQVVRTILARLLFKRDDVFKKVGILSGGERVKVAFAKVFVQDYNVLVLDEPTNYLDVFSQEALEEVLLQYEGTVLFISHDRRLIEKLADHILLFEDQKLVSFEGTFAMYVAKEKESRIKSFKKMERDQNDLRMQLENRLAQVVGKLSSPSKRDCMEELNCEYDAILEQLKAVRVIQD